MKPCYNIFPFNVFLPRSFSLKHPSWRVRKQCCCHIKFSHIKSSETFSSIGKITKKISPCLKWPICRPQNGHVRGEQRESILTAAASIYPIDTEYDGMRARPSGSGISPPDAALCQQKQLLVRGLQKPGRSWWPGPHGLTLSFYFVLTVSVSGDAQCEQEGRYRNRKIPTGLLSDFILWFYTNRCRG